MANPCWQLVGLTAALTVLPGCRGGGYVYTPRDGAYTVTFPAKPQEQTLKVSTPIGTVTSDSATLNAVRGVSYVSISTRYPLSSRNYDVAAGLDLARNALARNMSGTVDHETAVTIGSVSGRDFEVAATSGARARSRVFIDASGPNPVNYQVMVTDPAGKIETPEADAFLKSLKLPKR